MFASQKYGLTLNSGRL